MRLSVTITPPGATAAFTLGDDSAARELSGRNWPNGAGGGINDGFLGKQDRKIDKGGYFRAGYSFNIPRANLENGFPLRVTRTFDTETNMIYFRITHADLVPVNGLLTVTIKTSDSVIQCWLANAIIGPIDFIKHTGVTGVWTYPIYGNGPWLTAKPTS